MDTKKPKKPRPPKKPKPDPVCDPPYDPEWPEGGHEGEYTRDHVVFQSLIAFGQGTDYVRVNHHAAEYIATALVELDTRFNLSSRWYEVAVQFLERVRMTGRVSASLAIQAGRTYIDDEDVAHASIRVKLISKSEFCGPDTKREP